MIPAVLLEVEGEIGREASRSHLAFPFELREGVGRLELEFSFAPAFLEDGPSAKRLAAEACLRFGLPPGAEEGRSRERIRNLLTVSLDDPAGFRGCAHRHRPSQAIFLSATEATPGFLPGPLGAGRWRATISVHLVASPSCAYRLRVIAT